MNKYVIGITGFAGSGKDLFADYLVDELLFNYISLAEKYSFAEPIKRGCSELFNISLDDFYDRDKKEQVIPLWGKSPRELLIMLGTDMLRDQFDPKVWTKSADIHIKRNIKNNVVTVLPDIRFNNEYDLVKEHDGFMINILSDVRGVSGINHVSESGLSGERPADYIVRNNGTKNGLHLKAREINESIFKRCQKL